MAARPVSGAPARRGRFRAVSIGGGTGQPNLIRVLRRLDCTIDSIVAMADDGGSTGILRERAHIVPPGDIRKCLSALAADESSPAARAFAHRFPYVDNHALGNLVITALAEETGSFVEAIRECERMLGCVGHVHPSTLDFVRLSGRASDGRVLSGQAALCHGDCALESVWLEPGGARAYGPAVDAVMAADLVVLGPGSLFTSIIPNILVEGVRDAVRETDALVVFVCPKADRQGETWGMRADEYVDALERHGLAGAIDAGLVHRPRPQGVGVATRSFRALTDEQVAVDALERRSAQAVATGLDSTVDEVLARQQAVSSFSWRDVRADDAAVARIRERVPYVFARDFTDPASPVEHNAGRLADVFSEVIASCLLPRR